MEKIRFGKTNLMVSRTSFGAIPIQRLSFDESTALLRHAYDEGINLFDTARGYTDSEERIGLALKDVRKDIIITTKTPSLTRSEILKDIDESLKDLQTDYIDVYQFHNPSFVPKPSDEPFETMMELKKQGKIRFIGITNHDKNIAIEAVESKNYDVLQYPLSPISTEDELKLSKMCLDNDMGLLAMKALSGGLITNAKLSFAFLRSFPNIVPIFGMQYMWELEEFISYEKNPPKLTEEILSLIEKDKKELAGSFCRGCGYCLPCPAEIPIPMAARISLLLRRANPASYTTDEWIEDMNKIDNCIDCGNCKSHCPYNLDTPNLLKSELIKYKQFLKENNI